MGGELRRRNAVVAAFSNEKLKAGCPAAASPMMAAVASESVSPLLSCIRGSARQSTYSRDMMAQYQTTRRPIFASLPANFRIHERYTLSSCLTSSQLSSGPISHLHTFVTIEKTGIRRVVLHRLLPAEQDRFLRVSQSTRWVAHPCTAVTGGFTRSRRVGCSRESGARRHGLTCGLPGWLH